MSHLVSVSHTHWTDNAGICEDPRRACRRGDLGPFYQGVISVAAREPWESASAGYRLRMLERRLSFPVDGARFVPSNNNDVWRLKTCALIDFEFARMGPPDLELISVLRALEVETRLGVPRPPLLAEDYPELFAAPDLDRRLWLYAIAYTIRQIIFWPPDRSEADGLAASHPLHTLRRLIDAPLSLPA